MIASVKRREFIALLSGAATAWPLTAPAQQPLMPVVGFLRNASPEPDATNRLTAFRQGLKEAGFVDGQNVAIEYRSDQTERLPLLVADLLRRQVAVIVGNTPSALAAKAVTTKVPIVFVSGGDPVRIAWWPASTNPVATSPVSASSPRNLGRSSLGSCVSCGRQLRALPCCDPVRIGLVASLNQPGGNVTGISFITAELGSKQLGLLRELRPAAARIAVLVDPKWPLTQGFVSELRAAALPIGQQLIVLNASSGGEIETAFTALVQRGAGALQVGVGAFMSSQRERIVTLAARHAVPTISPYREFVEAGGLMSYAPSITDANRQAGIYAGRILKGENPGDLPVMLPTKFEFVINLKTAKALGVEIPDRLLIAADEVIE